ncbi:hypothetical protein KKC22_11770 [Myxococcota bacterium]|nr:hypothetical protein [Myxococcota bacterium]
MYHANGSGQPDFTASQQSSPRTSPTDTLEVELLVDWENLDNKDGTFAAGGRYSAWCAANTAYDAWVLWLYDSATGERTEVDTSHLGQCKELTGVDGDKVLFGTYRQIYGIFEGEVRAFTDIEFHVYDHTTGDLHTFANSPWWDQVAVGLAWPLVLYRDHGVFCYGWADAGYNSNNCSYLVIQNVESGVARPIPIPASPVDAGSSMPAQVDVHSCPLPTPAPGAHEVPAMISPWGLKLIL